MFTSYPHFTSKRTAARIDFLGQGGEVVDKKGSHSVKKCTKKRTKGEAIAGGLMSFRHWVN